MSVWRPKSGEYVQIWDHYAERVEDEVKINDHGKFGYILRESKLGESFKDAQGKERFLANIVHGEVFKIIVFDASGTKTVHVHQDNLRGVGKDA